MCVCVLFYKSLPCPAEFGWSLRTRAVSPCSAGGVGRVAWGPGVEREGGEEPGYGALTG